MGIDEKSAPYDSDIHTSFLDEKSEQIEDINDDGMVDTNDLVTPRQAILNTPIKREPYIRREPSTRVQFQEFNKRVLKYAFIFIVVIFAVKFFSNNEIDYIKAIKMAAVTAIVFALLDLYMPSMALGAGLSAGWSLGQSAVAAI